MLSASLLLVTLSLSGAPMPDQVLVFSTGHALTVQSYEVDGAVIRIVGEDGQPFVVRTERVDLEASRRISLRRVQQNAASEPTFVNTLPAGRTPSDRHEQSVVAASRRALAAGRRGGMSTTRNTDIDGEEPAPVVTEALADHVAAAPGSVAEAEGDDEPADTGVGDDPGAEEEDADAMELVGRFTLAAGASQTVTISADEAVSLWANTTLSGSEADACQSNCVELRDDAGNRASAAWGASIKSEPSGGRVQVTLDNPESFPISVELYRG